MVDRYFGRKDERWRKKGRANISSGGRKRCGRG
jgi:hypothetical protein